MKGFFRILKYPLFILLICHRSGHRAEARAMERILQITGIYSLVLVIDNYYYFLSLYFSIIFNILTIICLGTAYTGAEEDDEGNKRKKDEANINVSAG